jgi:hypothetical protein
MAPKVYVKKDKNEENGVHIILAPCFPLICY